MTEPITNTKRKVKAQPTLNSRKASSMWLEFFHDTVLELISDNPVESTIDKARQTADAAIDAFEARWPGVPYL